MKKGTAQDLGRLSLKNKFQNLQSSTKNCILIAFVIVVFMVIASIASSNFFTATNLTNVLQQISITGILTMGAGIVLISGNVDLSVAYMLTFVACFCAFLYQEVGLGFEIIPLLGMLMAVGCGALNGIIISRSKAESFIVTLGMSNVFHGLALFCTDAANISLGSEFEFLGNYRIPTINIPLTVIIFFAVFAGCAIVMRFTRYGRKIYALGGNEEAAALAGIHVKNHKLSVFMLNGALTGLAALMLLSRLGSANAKVGEGMEINAIAGAVVGGISMAGGRGSMVGALLGTFLLGIIQNALNILQIQTFYQYVVIGAIIVVAVLFSSYEKKK